MNKKLILSTILVCAVLNGMSEETAASPEEMPSMQYSYCRNPLDNVNLGVGLKTTYYSCIMLPANKGKSFGGNYITEVSIGIGAISDPEGELWLSYDPDNEPFYTQPIDLAEETIAQTYVLQKPHLIEEGKDLYIGWTCHADEYTNPIKGESDRSGSKADPRGDIVGYVDDEGLVNWKHLADTNFGNLLMSLTIQGEKLPSYDVALENVSIDPYVNVGSPLTVTGYVRNYGKQTIDSYVVTYRIGSNPPVSLTPQCWEMRTGDSYSFSFDIDKSVIGPNNLTININNPGGHSDVNPDDNTWSGTYICYSTTHPDRNVLLEQFSTAYCAQCPDGHDRIESATGEFDNVIWVTHHSGFYEDDLTTDDDRAMTWFYGSPQTYAPAMMLDRTNNSAGTSYITSGPVMNVGSKDEIKDAIIKASTQPSLAKINASCTFDDTSRLLTVNASGGSLVDLSSRPTMVNIYLVEDNIIGFQTLPGTVTLEYIHNNVFRKSLTGVWGEPVYWTGKSFEGIWEYTLPEEYKSENMRVVAFLSNYNMEDCNDCMVLDACQIPLKDPSSADIIKESGWKASVRSGALTIEGDFENIQITGIDGTDRGSIIEAGTYRLPQGVYILNDGTHTQRILMK